MRKIPDDPLAFIRQRVCERNIHWTYHVNMQLTGRHNYKRRNRQLKCRVCGSKLKPTTT